MSKTKRKPMFHVKQCKIRRNRSGVKGRWALVRAQERRDSRAAVKACVAARRSVWVCARSGSVFRQGAVCKENIRRKMSRRKNKGGFERRAGKTGREERREDGTNMRKIALLQGRCAVDLHTSGRITAKMEKNRQKN